MDPIGFDDDPPPEPRDGWLLVRIHVPELNVYKCLQFPSERLVWDVKQQVLASLPKVSDFIVFVSELFFIVLHSLNLKKNFLLFEEEDLYFYIASISYYTKTIIVFHILRSQHIELFMKF